MPANKVSDVMTPNVVTVLEDDTLESAARLMAEEDVGVLPVAAENDDVVGMLTDRDIIVNAIAKGKDPAKTTVGEIRRSNVVCVDAGDPVERATQLMAEHQIRRLPVVEGGKIVGIVSQGDLARSADPQRVGEMVGDISQPYSS